MSLAVRGISRTDDTRPSSVRDFRLISAAGQAELPLPACWACDTATVRVEHVPMR